MAGSNRNCHTWRDGSYQPESYPSGEGTCRALRNAPARCIPQGSRAGSEGECSPRKDGCVMTTINTWASVQSFISQSLSYNYGELAIIKNGAPKNGSQGGLLACLNRISICKMQTLTAVSVSLLLSGTGKEGQA